MEIKHTGLKFRRTCFFDTADDLKRFVDRVSRNNNYKIVKQDYMQESNRFFAVVEEVL